jgi:maleylpyruvate isomerase
MLLQAVDSGGQWELPGRDEVVRLAGPLAEITAYLTGRAHKLTTAGGEPAPVLGPWL